MIFCSSATTWLMLPLACRAPIVERTALGGTVARKMTLCAFSARSALIVAFPLPIETSASRMRFPSLGLLSLLPNVETQACVGSVPLGVTISAVR